MTDALAEPTQHDVAGELPELARAASTLFDITARAVAKGLTEPYEEEAFSGLFTLVELCDGAAALITDARLLITLDVNFEQVSEWMDDYYDFVDRVSYWTGP